MMHHFQKWCITFWKWCITFWKWCIKLMHQLMHAMTRSAFRTLVLFFLPPRLSSLSLRPFIL
jgi:hypothetical protein